MAHPLGAPEVTQAIQMDSFVSGVTSDCFSVILRSERNRPPRDEPNYSATLGGALPTFYHPRESIQRRHEYVRPSSDQALQRLNTPFHSHCPRLRGASGEHVLGAVADDDQHFRGQAELPSNVQNWSRI